MSTELGSNPYEIIGGEEAVKNLVNRFYDLMDEKEEVIGVRQMHAKTLRVRVPP